MTPMRGQNLSFVVQKGEQNTRLDIFLRTQTQLSRARVQSLLREGHVQVTRQGQMCKISASLNLHPSDRIALFIPPAQPTTLKPYAYPLQILHEDDHLLVLDKPAGLVVHPAPGHTQRTLVHALLAHCATSLSGIGGVTRPGIVHRLDKDTSGVMVVAKTDAAHHALAAQFHAHGQDGKLSRRYIAFVWGAPRRASDTINVPLGRHPRHRQKQAVRKQGGRVAQTEYRVLANWGHPPVISQLECQLRTGRTHQIRVHCAHIGCPVLGDPLYGSGFASRARKLPAQAYDAYQALGRQALHAAMLGFAHPATQARMTFTSALPQDMQRLIDAF